MCWALTCWICQRVALRSASTIWVACLFVRSISCWSLVILLWLFGLSRNNHSKITKDQQLIDLTNKQATQMVEADRKATLWQIQQVNAQHMYLSLIHISEP